MIDTSGKLCLVSSWTKPGSLPHLRGHLLGHQQIPSGLSQRQHFKACLCLMEVFALPRLYCQVQEHEQLALSPICTQQHMSSISDNISIEDVIHHLAAIGIMDHKVHEAHHYAVGWLSQMASPSNTHLEEPAAASEVLNHPRQTPNNH